MAGKSDFTSPEHGKVDVDGSPGPGSSSPNRPHKGGGRPDLELRVPDAVTCVGDKVRVVCVLAPWPDPKGCIEGVELDLGYETKLLGVTSTIRTAGLIVAEKKTALEEKFATNVVSEFVPASAFDDDGAREVYLPVPADAPPTRLGFRTSNWKVQGRLRYLRGRDKWTLKEGFHHTVSADVTIEAEAGLIPEIPSDRPPRILASGPGEKDVAVELEQASTPRGGAIRGRAVFSPDPLRFADEQDYLTKRGRRKALEMADVTNVAIDAATVGLVCFRCSTSGHVTREMWRTTSDLDLPAQLAVRTGHEVQFEIEVPTRATLGIDKTTKLEGDLPPSWYGDEIFRWMLLVEAKTSTKVGTFSSGAYASTRGPLSIAKEVLIT